MTTPRPASGYWWGSPMERRCCIVGRAGGRDGADRVPRLLAPQTQIWPHSLSPDSPGLARRPVGVPGELTAAFIFSFP